MAERRYSVAEIDRMRNSVRWLLIRPMVPYDPIEMAQRIDGQLRTYMLNGTEPEELERAVSEDIRAHPAAAVTGATQEGGRDRLSDAGAAEQQR